MDSSEGPSNDLRADQSWLSLRRLSGADDSPVHVLSRRTSEPISFEDAVCQFQDFLNQNGYPRNLVWLEPTDIALTGRPCVYVKVPVQAGNLTRAFDRFTAGMSNKLGVCFGTICEMNDSTCCYAWTPTSHQEQVEHWINPPLKFSAKMSRVPGIPVTRRLSWWLLKLRHHKYLNMREVLFY
jgi:hypothetical protein